MVTITGWQRTLVEVVAGGDDELWRTCVRQLPHDCRHLRLVPQTLPPPIANLHIL